eukprot:1841687-Rhodomonas_salina.4
MKALFSATVLETQGEIKRRRPAVQYKLHWNATVLHLISPEPAKSIMPLESSLRLKIGRAVPSGCVGLEGVLCGVQDLGYIMFYVTTRDRVGRKVAPYGMSVLDVVWVGITSTRHYTADSTHTSCQYRTLRSTRVG